MANSRVPMPATDTGIKEKRVVKQKQAPACQRLRGNIKERAAKCAARMLHPQARKVRVTGQTSRQVR